MPFKKTINFKKLEKKIIDKRESKLKLMGFEIISDIIARTQKGKDIKLKAFVKYTKNYAKEKRHTHGGSKPNLTRKSQMLNDITFKRIKDGIRFYFKSSQQRAKAHGNQRLRVFFGLDKNQKKKIQKELNKL